MKNNFISLAVIPALLLSVCFLFPTGCSLSQGSAVTGQERQTRTGFFLNTVISITIYGPSSEEIFDGCMELAEYYESIFSRTMEGSDIWNVNHSGGQPVSVHQETLALLKTALSYAEMSQGLVDPTIGPLSTLWNMGDENQGIVPGSEEILQALSHVNYKNIVIDGDRVSLLDPEGCLDLGFIAKGYIADRMKDYLLKEGIASAIINLGGNVNTIGCRPDQTPFRVGIQKPFAQSGDYSLTLEITDQSVVSSGNYERYFEKDGVLYHHILSTVDGQPARTGLDSVTIICNRSVDGDALSTLCFLLGYEKGRELVESLDDTEAVFITQDGAIYQTF